MKKYLFLLDSGSSYSVNLPPDTEILPIGITHQNETFFRNFSRDKIKQILASGEQLTTTQPIIGETLQLIQQRLLEYEKIIVLPISKDLSSHFASLCTLETEFADRVIILESQSIGIDGNWIVQELQQLLANNQINADSTSLNDWLKRRQQRVCGFVIVNDPNWLIKGGRLKGIKGLIAKHFRLKLIIKFDGKLQYVAKDRHLEGAVKKALEIVDAQIHFRNNGIKHVTVMDELSEPINKIHLNHHLGDALVENSLLPDCITCHTGFDTFSILIEANGKKQ